MNEKEYISRTIEFVKRRLDGAEAGHDWYHIDRVYRNALRIAKTEKADEFVVSLGALLHDIADSKFHDGNEKIGPQIARDFLKSMQLQPLVIERVVDIVENISFKNSLDTKRLVGKTPELMIVQDADRLDAIGAIGIARAFNYGGYKNRPFYDPDLSPNLKMSKEEYKRSHSPTINHFYEKLLLLKDRMNTETGKAMANQRHQYMLDFLDQFFSEFNTEF